MYNLDISVQIENSLNDLSEYSASSQFPNLPVWKLLDILSETDSFDIVCNEVYLLWSVN